MDDLIARLEAATKGNRKLDYAIYEMVEPDGFRVPADFTTSLDAALTLVAEGMYWAVGAGKTRVDEPLYGAAIYEPQISDDPKTLAQGQTDATPALALCIAALKARVTQA